MNWWPTSANKNSLLGKSLPPCNITTANSDHHFSRNPSFTCVRNYIYIGDHLAGARAAVTDIGEAEPVNKMNSVLTVVKTKIACVNLKDSPTIVDQ